MYIRPMNLDRKLFQDIDVGDVVKVDPDMFGVEVELEGRDIRNQKAEIRAFWDIHADGSLRVNAPGAEAIEYVFRQPFNIKGTYTALQVLLKFLNTPPAEVFPSYRTSIHVHVNCAAETYRTIYNFITLAIIFDELFVSQNGDHRVGNNFCLRAKDAQGQITELINSIEINGSIFGVNAQHRYSSVNFVSLMKYGTLEFRSLECTLDFDRIKHWIDTLARLKAVSRQFEDPQDIIRYYSRMSSKEFLYFVLGQQALKYSQVNGMDTMLQDGMRLAQDFAYCSKWVNRTKEEETKGLEDIKNLYAAVDVEAQHQFNELMNIAREVEVDRVQVQQAPRQRARRVQPLQPAGIEAFQFNPAMDVLRGNNPWEFRNVRINEDGAAMFVDDANGLAL